MHLWVDTFFVFVSMYCRGLRGVHSSCTFTLLLLFSVLTPVPDLLMQDTLPMHYAEPMAVSCNTLRDCQ